MPPREMLNFPPNPADQPRKFAFRKGGVGTRGTGRRGDWFNSRHVGRVFLNGLTVTLAYTPAAR